MPSGLKKFIIAIDGPAGAGKSTVAKLVAEKLDYLYIDTGAMYRAVTLKMMKAEVPMSDTTKIIELTKKTVITFKKGNGKLLTFLDSEDVSEAIRAPEVSRNCSAFIANIQGVREHLVLLQREMGKEGGIVMEGRDIATVVFPNADKKFYLDAALSERINRRLAELELKGVSVNREELENDMKRRDHEDKNRPGGALRLVPDASLIDTTSLSVDEVAENIVREVEKLKVL